MAIAGFQVRQCLGLDYESPRPEALKSQNRATSSGSSGISPSEVSLLSAKYLVTAAGLVIELFALRIFDPIDFGYNLSQRPSVAGKIFRAHIKALLGLGDQLADSCGAEVLDQLSERKALRRANYGYPVTCGG
jgi:hypothetical protein